MDDPVPVLEENSPESLMNVCTDYCVRHLETFCRWDVASGAHVLRDGLTLPSVICEALLQRQHARRPEVLDDTFLRLFANADCSRLRHVDVSDCTAVTDDGLRVLLPHRLVKLNVTNCIRLTDDTLAGLNRHGQSLQSLVIGNSNHILPDTLDDCCDPGDFIADGCVGDVTDDILSSSRPIGRVLNTPNLRQLVLKNFQCPSENGAAYLTALLGPLLRLTHLDLSGCAGLGDLSALLPLSQLASLTLYNVPELHGAVANICKLSNLRHLDISQSGEKHGVFHNPNQVMTQLTVSLPLLSSLDISGTNLGGAGVEDCPVKDKDVKSNATNGLARPKYRSSTVRDIPGLQSRAQRPLDFLGLLNTSYEACHRECIPARKIAGDADEQQILTAATAYHDRPEVLQRVLNDLFRIFRLETCRNPQLALKLILQAMQHHLTEKPIQISGSASLFYIVKDEGTAAWMNIKIKKMIISTTLDAMCEHKTDPIMTRNGCLTLCNFRIPQDVLFDYRRLVEVILYIFSVEDQEDFVQRVGIYLINSLACQVDGDQKRLMGELGAIQAMLQLIRWRLRRSECDEVMEIAWSTMWNVTDETSVNCKRFLENGGMDNFLGCLHAFPNNPELLRNMMGLIGNVAEVESLRPMLMSPKYIHVFSDLLDNYSDGIEVAYNAAGVLSHIASDGHWAWTLSTPTRAEVLRRMAWAIERWDIRTKRNINYRSFEPIFRLLKVDHTPEAQHWAVWALANLTSVYPEKYCSLVKDEGGLQLLEELMKKENPYWRIKELAQLVITHCDRYKRFGTLDADLHTH